MKHIIKSGAIATALFCSAIFAGDKALDKIVNINQLTQESIATFVQGSECFVIECSEGTVLPLRLILGGELLRFEKR